MSSCSICLSISTPLVAVAVVVGVNAVLLVLLVLVIFFAELGDVGVNKSLLPRSWSDLFRPIALDIPFFRSILLCLLEC